MLSKNKTQNLKTNTKIRNGDLKEKRREETKKRERIDEKKHCN